MRLELGKIVTEPTGYKPGGRVPEFVARCWLCAGFDGLRFAYGASEDEAKTILKRLLETTENGEIT